MNTQAPLSRKVFWLTGIAFIVTLVIRCVLVTWYNSNYGGIEQNVIYGIQRLLMGRPLYQDPQSGSYAVIQYMPLYYYFIAGLCRLAHVQYTDVQGIYVLCRTLALFFNLLTVVTVALTIRSCRFSWLYAWGCAAAVLVVLTSHFYTRGDSMQLFLFIAAVYAGIRYVHSGRLHHILIAALFSAGCLLIKQSGILIVAILSFALLFIGRRLLVTLFYGLCTALFTFLMMRWLASDSHILYQNIYLGLKNGTDLSFLYLIFTSQYFLDMVPCYFVGWMMVWLAIKRVKDNTFMLLASGAAISFLFAVITGLKVGSSNNYFIEFLVFVIAGLPYVLAYGEQALFHIGKRVVSIRVFAVTTFSILIISKTVGFVTVVFIEKGLKDHKEEYTKEKDLYEHMCTHLYLQEGERIFFTDRQFFDNIFAEYTIMPTKDVVRQVYAAGHQTFDYSSFTSGMNNGLVKYIITSEAKPSINEWNTYIPFILFDTTKFVLAERYNGYTIYAYSPSLLK